MTSSDKILELIARDRLARSILAELSRCDSEIGLEYGDVLRGTLVEREFDVTSQLTVADRLQELVSLGALERRARSPLRYSILDVGAEAYQVYQLLVREAAIGLKTRDEEKAADYVRKLLSAA